MANISASNAKSSIKLALYLLDLHKTCDLESRRGQGRGMTF